MAYELGVAYLPVVPETSKIAPGIKKAMNDATRGADAPQAQGSRMGDMLATGFKKSLKVAGIGAAIVGGIAVKGGISRLMGIEDARASLSGLGHDAKAVDKIMANALNSVRGTAFGMADAGKVAASSVAAGIKPGQDLERHLRLVADAATIAKVPLGEMGGIFAKVAASNKVQGDVINQLNDKGIPIVQLLSRELGISAEEVYGLSQKGKIGFDDFSRAMQSGLGGAALKSGETLRGSIANLNASLGRIGAGLFAGVYPKIAPAIQSLTKNMGGAEDGAVTLGSKIGDLLAKYAVPFIGAVRDVAKFLARVVKVAWDYKEVLAVLGVGLVAYKGYLVAARIAEGALAIWRGRQLIAMYAVTVAQRAMNKAMKANPIGAVITVLTLLAAGLTLAYKKSDTFRSIVDKAWAGIKVGISAAWSVIKPVFTAVASWVGAQLPKVFGVLKTVAGVVFTIIGTYIKVWWTVAKGIFSAVSWYVKNVLGPIFSWLWGNIIKPVFGFIGRLIAVTWNNVIKPAFSKLRGGVGAVVDAFSAARSGIKRAWDKLGDIVRGPIDAAKRVISGFIGLINKIPGVEIKNPFSGSAARETGSDAARARRGFATGGWTGPGSKYQAAGIVHADEFVISKRARRLFEAKHPGVLNFINQTGRMPLHGGYAEGGRVIGAPLSNPHSRAQYPWATFAGDFAAPTGTPVHAWKSGVIAAVRSLTTSYGKHIRMNHTDGTSSLYAHLSRFAVSPGDRVRAGALIGNVGSTGNSTGPHLHLELMGGLYRAIGALKNAGGSIWDTLKGAGGRIDKWIREKLVGKGNVGGIFGNLGGLFKNIGGGVKDHVLGDLFDAGGEAHGVGFMAKNTIAPERVLSPSSTRALNEGLRSIGRGNGQLSGRITITNWEEGTGYFESVAEGVAEGVSGGYRGMDGQLGRMERV